MAWHLRCAWLSLLVTLCLSKSLQLWQALTMIWAFYVGTIRLRLVLNTWWGCLFVHCFELWCTQSSTASALWSAWSCSHLGSWLRLALTYLAPQSQHKWSIMRASASDCSGTLGCFSLSLASQSYGVFGQCPHNIVCGPPLSRRGCSNGKGIHSAPTCCSLRSDV